MMRILKCLKDWAIRNLFTLGKHFQYKGVETIAYRVSK